MSWWPSVQQRWPQIDRVSWLRGWIYPFWPHGCMVIQQESTEWAWFSVELPESILPDNLRKFKVSPRHSDLNHGMTILNFRNLNFLLKLTAAWGLLTINASCSTFTGIYHGTFNDYWKTGGDVSCWVSDIQYIVMHGINNLRLGLARLQPASQAAKVVNSSPRSTWQEQLA